MKLKSIKSSLQLIAVLLLALICFLISIIHTSRQVAISYHEYHRILNFEKSFADTLIRERIITKNLGPLSDLMEKYKHLQHEAHQIGFDAEKEMLVNRETVFNALYKILLDIEQQLLKVGRFLPDMIESVRYIHEHHIVYLKNLLRRGHLTQDWDVSEDFKRSPVRSAPETEIIQMAVTIQNKLLDVFSIFYNLKISESPSSLRDEFQRKIKEFYLSVNIFEDYSLDAQDGLLVEELLFMGRDFENSFTELLSNEEKSNQLSVLLEQNSATLFDRFKSKRNQIVLRNNMLKQRLETIQYISTIASALIITFLLFYGQKITRAFKRTVAETEKIQNDLSYHIHVKQKDYQELRFVFEALNSMARTIEGQIRDLENARKELSIRVKERTAELEKANRRLKKEINDRRKSEKERFELETKLNRARKMEAIGLLAGGVAHDLNNILSGLVSYPELLLMDLPEDSSLRQPIETIKKSGEKAAYIVEDLLTLARRGVSATEPINLNTIISEFLNSIEFKQLKAYHPDTRTTCELNRDLLNIECSSVHLSKMIMNLVTNAFEAMPEGGELIIKTENRYIDRPVRGYDIVAEGDYVVLSISDSGVGISENDMERIFEPFYTKKVMGRSGSGLGMSVVWGTVKDCKGYIDVTSELNRGSTFTIYLPGVAKDLPEIKSSITISDITGHGEKILIVDDIEEQREIASRILNKLNYRVDTVPSGEMAIEYLKENEADLLILDMIMDPGIDGLETYQQIIKIHPHQKAIVASGYAETERVRLAKKLGVGDYVKKPYTFEKLGLAVHREFEKHKSEGKIVP